MGSKKTNPYETLTAVVTVLVIVHWLTGWQVFLIIGMVIGLLGSFFKRFAFYVHWLWMWIAKGLNFMVSNILLSIIFFLILTPIAVFFRLMNRRKLMSNLKRDSFYHEINQEFKGKDLVNPW